MEGGQRILIVEDDLVLKDLLGHKLAGTYSLTYASDGEEALVSLERVHPELILLDLMMPKLDGFGVLERVRARTDVLKNVPIIVLSNLDQESDESRARAAGANDYLVKANVSVDEIASRVRAILPPSA